MKVRIFVSLIGFFLVSFSFDYALGKQEKSSSKNAYTFDAPTPEKFTRDLDQMNNVA